MLGKEAVAAEAKRQLEKKRRAAVRGKEKQEGSGLIDLPDRVLLNIDLNEACKHLLGWRGVFSRDKLPESPYLTKCGILNRDDFKGPGTHWVAWYCHKAWLAQVLKNPRI